MLTLLAWAHLFVFRVCQYLQSGKSGTTPSFWLIQLTFIEAHIYLYLKLYVK
jgi:hypothetical protein